jgi:hypothetical protein
MVSSLVPSSFLPPSLTSLFVLKAPPSNPAHVPSVTEVESLSEQKQRCIAMLEVIVDLPAGLFAGRILQSQAELLITKALVSRDYERLDCRQLAVDLQVQAELRSLQHEVSLTR